MPTVIEDKMCINNSMIPIVVSPIKLIPTVPTIKRGPRVVGKSE